MIANWSHQRGQLGHAGRERRLQRPIVARGRLAPQPGVQPQNLLDQLDQLIQAVIGHAVFRRGKQAELSLKSQSVPRIDHCPALDRTVQEILDLDEHVAARVEFAALDRQMAGRQPALDLAGHAGRRHRHDLRLVQGRLRVAHPRKQQGQVHVLQLRGAAPGKLLVEMLPRAGQRLLAGDGLGPEPLAMRTRRALR